MKLDKAMRRDRKRRNKVKHGRDGDSVKLIQELQEKRVERIVSKKRKEQTEAKAERIDTDG